MSSPSPAAPSPAERVRTVLTTAATADIWWLDDRHGRTGPVATPAGTLVIERADPARASRPVLVEVADAAPLPARSRIRARVRLSGHAVVDDDQVVRVCPAGVELLRDGDSAGVSPDSVLAADPDPLAQVEGVLLGHLAHAHPEVVERLTTLLSPRLLHGVVRVLPHALDQYGLVVRLEYARDHRDVRLAFAAPAGCALEVRHELASLMADAGSRRARRRCLPHNRPA